MCQRFKIQPAGLMTIERPFLPDQTIRLNEIRLVEVHGKSIVPPLVIAIFLVAAQAILLTTVTSISFPGFASDGLPAPVLNIPIIICILLALIRARYITLKITMEGEGRLLQLHFMSRLSGEKLVSGLQAVTTHQDETMVSVD